MSDIFLGEREANYRERSNCKSMAGIAYGQSFMCKLCGQAKSSVGRQLVIKGYSKGGYKCAACASEAVLSGAVSPDVKTPASQGCIPRLASK